MIRQAEPADQGAIAALIDAAYSQYIPIIGRKPRPMLDDHAARIAKGEHFVCEDETGLRGVITLTPDGENALLIFNVAVHPDAQGRGLLREMLAFAEQAARERGLGVLRLYTNALMVKNRAIYTRLGFTELREEEGQGYRIVFMDRAVPLVAE